MDEEQYHIKLDASWKKELLPEFQQPYMRSLQTFLAREKRAGKEIYPRGEDMFNAFNLTPFDKVKVVIRVSAPHRHIGKSLGIQDGNDPPVHTNETFPGHFTENSRQGFRGGTQQTCQLIF